MAPVACGIIDCLVVVQIAGKTVYARSLMRIASTLRDLQRS